MSEHLSPPACRLCRNRSVPGAVRPARGPAKTYEEVLTMRNATAAAVAAHDEAR